MTRQDDIAADAVTGCLRTSSNALSLWVCSEDAESIEDIVLALATGPEKSHFEAVQFLVVPRVELEGIGLDLQDSSGDTLVVDLQNRHVDAVEVTLRDLTKVAHVFSQRLSKDQGYHRFTKKEVEKLVLRAIDSGRLQLADLHPQLREKLEERTAS
jgi:hypothetical protein